MQFSHFIQLSYWFSQPYALQSTTLGVMVGVFLALVCGGIVALAMRGASQEKAMVKFLGRVAGCAITMGVLGLVWLFLRAELVPLFAWRFWMLLWLALFVAWGTPLVRYALVRLPAVRQENIARSEKEKYLP